MLIAAIAQGRALPGEVNSQILARTDGVPLFIEELTKAVLESGLLRKREHDYVLDGPLTPVAIPTTLHASLMARLDRLPSVRQVAQVGAALCAWALTISCLRVITRSGGRRFGAANSPLRTCILSKAYYDMTAPGIIPSRSPSVVMILARALTAPGRSTWHY